MNEENIKKADIPQTMIDRETAENEFERWVDAMKIKIDRSGMDENDRRDIAEDREQIVSLIMEGRIEINDNDLLVFQPEEGRAVTFYRPRGGDLVVMDKKKKNADLGKINASMAAVTRTSEPTFAKMFSSDYQICQVIWSLFLV